MKTFMVEPFGYIQPNFPKSVEKKSTIANCLGMIPIVGVIIGLAKIITVVTSNPDKEFKTPRDFRIRKLTVFRATLEICGLGLLCLIPDIIITIARHRQNKLNQSPIISQATEIRHPNL